MAAVAYSELRDRARAASDMRESDFVTPTDWLRWANLERQALEVFIARSGIVLTETQSTITVGTTTALAAGQYELTDPLAVLGVYELRDNRYRRLRSSDQMDGAGFRTTSVTGQAQIYRVLQESSGKIVVQFYPIPVSGVYIVVQVPQPEILIADDDEVNYPLGWEERIVLGMAKRALSKEESPTSQIDDQIRQVDRLVEEAAWDRLFAANQKIRNVDRVERGWYRWQDFPLLPTREYWYFV